MTGSGGIGNGAIWSGHSGRLEPNQPVSVMNQNHSTTPTEAAILAARVAFDLAIDVRTDVPGIYGRLAAALLALASRVLYRYAIGSKGSRKLLSFLGQSLAFLLLGLLAFWFFVVSQF